MNVVRMQRRTIIDLKAKKKYQGFPSSDEKVFIFRDSGANVDSPVGREAATPGF
jgi:hypothetical protein